MMTELFHPNKRLLQTILYRGVEFEVIEHPEAIWVGCVDYASGNTDESEIAATLKRYRQELIDVPKQQLITPDCSAALSINYTCNDKPCGLMFAQVSYSDKQDERYDIYKTPTSLFIRVKHSLEVGGLLLGRPIQGNWELFGVIKEQVMPEYGYILNANEVPEIEYYNHKQGTCYAYVPVAKK